MYDLLLPVDIKGLYKIQELPTKNARVNAIDIFEVKRINNTRCNNEKTSLIYIHDNFFVSNKLAKNILFQKHVMIPLRNEFDIVNISTLFLVNVKLSPEDLLILLLLIRNTKQIYETLKNFIIWYSKLFFLK